MVLSFAGSAIPPPALSGSGSRVEGRSALLSAWFSQAPRAILDPVRKLWNEFRDDYLLTRPGSLFVSITNAELVVKSANAAFPLFLQL